MHFLRLKKDLKSPTTDAVGSVKESRASLSGGIVFMFQLAGAGLGLALITTIFTEVTPGDLMNRINSAGINLSESELASIKSLVLGSGTESTLISEVGQGIWDNLETQVEHSYVRGVKIGLGVSGFIALFGAVISLVSVKNRDVLQR